MSDDGYLAYLLHEAIHVVLDIVEFDLADGIAVLEHLRNAGVTVEVPE